MLDVTKIAVDQFKKILTNVDSGQRGIRIFKADDGCCGTPSLGIDAVERPEAGDAIIDKDGLSIYVDGSVADLLSTAVIDYTGEAKGFAITGLPRSSSQCGTGACG
jgi:iron-sulfur cluster assembly accessory protein